MDDFDKVYDATYTTLEKRTPATPPPGEPSLVHGVEVVGFSTIGILMNGKLTSQQQIKLRKSFIKWVDDLVKWSDPRMNVLMANKIHYEHLKQKKLKELR